MMHMGCSSCLRRWCRLWMIRHCACDTLPSMDMMQLAPYVPNWKMKYNHLNSLEVMMIFHKSRRELLWTCSLPSFMNFENFGHDPALRIDTWYLDYPRHITCRESRSVRLGRDLTSWLRDIVSEWHDHIDTTWPVNIVVVRPVPATVVNRQPNINVIVLQRALHGMAANHFTIIDSSRSRTEQRCFAGFAPQHLDKHHAIVAADITIQCASQESRHRCMIWHGDRDY